MADDADVLGCTFEFKSNDLVCYEDTYGRSAEAKIDPAGLTWRTIAVLAGWVRDHDGLFRRRELEVLGSHLYDLLSAGDVGRKFDESYKALKNKSSAGRVRLELCFQPEAEDLARLPWEFLYLPGRPGRPGGFFLAGEKRWLVLTRQVPRDLANTSVRAAEYPLKVLVAACHHVPMARSYVEQIKDTINGMSTPGDIRLKTLDDPEFGDLSREVEHYKPHVLHLIAHGRPGRLLMKKRVDPGDALAREARGEPPPADEEYIEARTVPGLFEAHQPHLVLLHACDGDKPELMPANGDAPAFTLLFSTARQVAYAGVPAVVAMQYPISVEHALIFVKEFYEALASGDTVSDATKKGRARLANTPQAETPQAGAETSQEIPVRDYWATRLFGAPVVYVQHDIQLIAKREPAGTPRPDRFASLLGENRLPATARGPEVPRGPTSPARRRRRCSNCDTANNPARSDCWSCHASLRNCSYCGQEYEDLQADECSRCGEPLWLDTKVGGVYAGVGGAANGGVSDGAVVSMGGAGEGVSVDGGTMGGGTMGGASKPVPPGTHDPGPGRSPGPVSGIVPRSAAG